MVEIPRGSRNKYEYDEETGVFRLDRVLSSAVYYNFDYGFIEGTRAGDGGSHTDALLIIDEPTFTGCHVRARPIGGLGDARRKGFDFTVLCVAIGDAHQQHIERPSRCARIAWSRFEHFFQTYKALEDKTVDMVGWRDGDRALGCSHRPGAVGAGDRQERLRMRGPQRRDLARHGPAWPAPLRRRPVVLRRDRGPHRYRAGIRTVALHGNGRDVRWVRLEGLHLTLRFLGPTLDDRVEPTTEAALRGRDLAAGVRGRPG